MSPNQNLSRHDVLKLALASAGATFLAACGRALGIPVTSFPTPIPCFKLLTPENGTKLPAIGEVTFSWKM